ncbi:hypothetical protein TNCV_2069051 [Trichonephila clavipes]|uniref:Uncharacterized protein n=1 Tax=Trichonephila clavipes TaxID=2585209 RepID=A0A8X7BD50_TRICX|nr:hypothetical protein TNCV_2069051 [Trichonephila clavipes]
MVKRQGGQLNRQASLQTSTPCKGGIRAPTYLTCISPTTRRLFSGTGFELMIRQPRFYDHNHLATTSTLKVQRNTEGDTGQIGSSNPRNSQMERFEGVGVPDEIFRPVPVSSER